MIASLKQDLGRSCDDILVAAIRQKPAQVEQLICLLSKIPLQVILSYRIHFFLPLSLPPSPLFPPLPPPFLCTNKI